MEPISEDRLAPASSGIDDLLAAERGHRPVVDDYIQRNRLAWEQWSSAHIAAGRQAWQADELRWGLWGSRESELRLLEGFETGDDVIDLGCGTAASSAWLARMNLRPVAVDFARSQLRSIEAFQREFGVWFPTVAGNAEEVPYDSDSFDLAISEYGVSLWSDPRRWLPEAWRLLRPEGRLFFFTTSPILTACTPTSGGRAEDRLLRKYFGLFRVEFDQSGPVEFHLTHGHWLRLLRATGFVVDDLIEVRPHPEARPRYDIVSPEWAQHWPSEDVWIAHKA